MHISSTFPRLPLFGGISQEILQRLKYKRPEAPASRIRTFKDLTLEHHRKKILCEILGVGNGIAKATNESENRSPINLAELGERGLRFLFVPPKICARQNDTPARGHEASVTVLASG